MSVRSPVRSPVRSFVSSLRPFVRLVPSSVRLSTKRSRKRSKDLFFCFLFWTCTTKKSQRDPYHKKIPARPQANLGRPSGRTKRRRRFLFSVGPVRSSFSLCFFHQEILLWPQREISLWLHRDISVATERSLCGRR